MVLADVASLSLLRLFFYLSVSVSFTFYLFFSWHLGEALALVYSG